MALAIEPDPKRLFAAQHRIWMEEVKILVAAAPASNLKAAALVEECLVLGELVQQRPDHTERSLVRMMMACASECWAGSKQNWLDLEQKERRAMEHTLARPCLAEPVCILLK